MKLFGITEAQKISNLDLSARKELNKVFGASGGLIMVH